MHGLTHLTGGSDPIPGLLPGPAGSYVDKILAEPSLVAYWPLDDDSGDALDHSGNSHDLPPFGTPTYGQPGPFPAVPDATSILFDAAAGDYFRRTDSDLDGYGGTGVTIECWVYPTSYPASTGYQIVYSGSLSTAAFNLQVRNTGDVLLNYGSNSLFSGTPLGLNVWTYVAATLSPTAGVHMYFDGGEVAAAGNFTPLNVGVRFDLGQPGDGFGGRLAQVALYSTALAPGTINDHATAPDGLEDTPGLVLGIGDDGTPEWIPPAVVVEHGDGEPAPEPVTNPWVVSGGTSTSGWHLEAHVETAVLYDSSPGRFDVPSQKWVRVPFNTVRFWRRWEPTVGAANLKTEWLPDDRGLTLQARDGILHIAAGMEGTPDVGGYHQRVVYWPFSPEWPFLDWSKLPNSPISVPGIDPANIDAYVRAARAVDLSHGFVLRDSTGGPAARQFFEWDMWVPADGTPEWVGYTVDNPYPVYPVWAGRPLVLPAPYPKLTDRASGQYYAPHKTVATSVTLAAGSNLCVQAWQDAPWLLRFSTDTYRIPYPGLTPKYLLRPHLAVSYSYDPETIDHTTGKLL